MLRKTILSQSLRLAFAASTASLLVVPAVFAQSTTVGSIYGQVADNKGDQVLVENLETGLKRTIAVEGNGRFSASALPPGRYQATLLKDGKSVSVIGLTVLAGQGAGAVFSDASGTQQLESVLVTGRTKTIDVTSSENGATFTAKTLDALPISSKDLNGVILLASNTVKADSRYSGGVSIGGGAPSENAYYINGFPVTNALTQLGSIELPFGAIAQADVKTGGFGAEFGRSVGGVVNVTTKSGSNEWHGGVNAYWEPSALRAKKKSIYYPDTGANSSTDGTVYYDRSKDTEAKSSYGFNIGGPLIKDKLFVFVAGDQTLTNSGYVSATPQSAQLTSSGWTDSKDRNSRYLTKIDWLISDDHQLELTVLGDNYYTENKYSGYDYSTHKSTGFVYSQSSKNLGGVTPAVGGEAQILKYTGNITQDFTLTALYGQSTSKHSDSYSFTPTTPSFSWSSTGRNPNLTYVNAADTANPLAFGSTTIGDDAHEKTQSLRLDGEYRLKKHTLRAGLDENRLRSYNAGEHVAGGSSWYYASTTNASYSGAGNGTTAISAVSSPVNGRYYYAYQYIFDDVTDAQSNQSAQYIEDTHKVTDTLILKYGLRNEGFVNKNGDGETFLESKNFLSPRFAAAWDVNGDASLKVYGSAGRYSLQIPTHVAVRGASRSTYTRQYYAYTGVDQSTGLPTGLTALGTAYSSNNEYGQAKDVKTVSALDVKPTYQDEITLGFEKALAPAWTGGVKATYRQLKQTIDDLCDARPFEKYAEQRNIDTTNWGGFGCASFNPGKANSFLVDYSGTGDYTRVDLSAADLGFQKPRRTYFALDFSLEHSFRDNWYGKVTYTYSKSKGNTEGQTKSDTGQTDVAATSTWDTPELMEGSYGYLPNDRTHQIKAYGYAQVTSQWGFGSNWLIQSGRPKNCFGNYGGSSTNNDEVDYGAYYFYCDGKLTPRGSMGRLPWSFSVDANAVYKPASIPGMAVRLDVFNVLNSQTVQSIDETRETSYDSSSVLSTYGRVRSYSPPRAVRISAEYNF